MVPDLHRGVADMTAARLVDVLARATGVDQTPMEEWINRFPPAHRPAILRALRRVSARAPGLRAASEEIARRPDPLARDCQIDAENESNGDWTR